MLQTDTSRVTSESSLNITGLVLSGGKGTRMGGVEKGLVDFQGKPMVSFAIAVLEPLCSTLILSANRQLEYYQTVIKQSAINHCIDVVSDVPEFSDLGPLSGILSALEYMGDDYSHLLICPCDTPMVSTELFQALISKAENSPKTLFYIQSESGDHPLHAIIPTHIKKGKTRTLLRAFLRGNKPKVMRFYQFIEAQSLIWTKENELLNFNHPEN